MTSITVLAGERTIGGTLIVVEDRGARLLFDCGMAYNPASDPFVHVARRPGRELSDLILAGLVPNLPGVFAPRVIDPLPSYVRPALPSSDGPAAVALSHSHLDHSHLAGFVDPSVPIYASAPTARIVDLLGRLGDAVGGQPSSLRASEAFSVGTIQVRFVPIDHDVCGARGMLIETTDGVIAYSGDLRLHGSHPEQTLAFARAARQAEARVLILEGTRLGVAPLPDPEAPAIPEDRVEDDVAPEVVRALKAIPGKLGVILLTPENGERVEAVAAAVAEAGRLLVMEPQALAFTIAALGRPLAAPYAVYTSATPESGWQAHGSATDGIEATPETAPRRLTATDIAASPGEYLLQLSFGHFAELLDIGPAGQGGAILACNGPPLGRFDPAWLSLEWWAAALGFQIVDVGSTGHAAPHDLALIAGHSRAPAVMSIHSRQPELLPVSPERLLLPERGRAYDLSTMP